MELSRKHVAIVLVVLFLGSVTMAGVAIAKTSVGSSTASTTPPAIPSASSGLHLAPVNPEFTQFVNAQAARAVVTQTPDGNGFGAMPSPVDMSQINTGKGSDPQYAQAYPATFDLRTKGKVSPVSNQGTASSCWVFATYGSLESYLWPSEKLTFSEKHLMNFAGFTGTCTDSGQLWKATAYLARWGTTMKYFGGGTIYAGPVKAACDPYPLAAPYCSNTKPACTLAKHVQTVRMFPGRTSALDNNAIKYGLQTYGALYVGMHWQGASTQKTPTYNPATAAYYDNTNVGYRHFVTVVGWNDNFPKTSFSKAAPGNGAFICKNSWGEKFGKAGFFYVSYYDTNFGYKTRYNNAAAVTASPIENFKTNYQYDPYGWVGLVGYNSPTAYTASVFTAKAGTLKAVGLYSAAANTAYTIKIYKNPTIAKPGTPDNPSSGTLVATKTGTIGFAGYYTTSLLKAVPLTAGQKFSVVIKYTAPGLQHPVPVSTQVIGSTDRIPDSVAHHCFASPDGTAWIDYASAFPVTTGVVNTIHAFAS